MKVADNQVAVCWNSIPQDLKGDEIIHNFRLVQKCLGEMFYVRQLNEPGYPYSELFRLLTKSVSPRLSTDSSR